MIGYFAQLAICLDHERNVGSLDGNFDQIKINFFEICDLLQSRFHHRFGSQAAIFFVQRRVKRTTVDTNPNWHLAIAGLGCNRFDVFRFTNVSRIETQSMHTRFHCR